LEGARDPAECIGNAPNCHADAPLDREAALGDRLVCLSLSTKLCGSGGSVHAEVKLSVHNVDIQRCKATQNSLERCLVGQRTRGRGGFRGKVSLEDNMVSKKADANLPEKLYLKTDAINVNTVALDELDNALGTKSLVAIVLEVVVVIEEVRLRAGLLGKLEGQGQESLANGVIEWRRAVGTIFVECLIDDVL
jgi:hypothetical protein